tara:strand:- start:703 stop:936 length:234 start_codon:yes stop_codon:yes gene_type:complete
MKYYIYSSNFSTIKYIKKANATHIAPTTDVKKVAINPLRKGFSTPAIMQIVTAKRRTKIKMRQPTTILVFSFFTFSL